MKKNPLNWWALFWAVLALLYFFVPLYGTFDFSLRMERGKLSLLAYQNVLSDPQFLASFRYSATMGIITVVVSVLLFLPTIYWMYLRLPQARPIVELITILPFIIPVIVFVFGLIRTFSGPPLQLTITPFKTDILITAGYVILSMPYMYRAIDIGMRSIDVRTLTEAAQSLGSNWLQILFNVIFPNLRVAVLSGALICFATVIGELILGDFLVRPALGPYMVQVGRDQAYQPAAMAMLSWGLTWICLGLIQFFSRGRTSQQQFTGR
ncbi:MAG TPA: ABC transporter permease subunit [Anaerolineales bacterium]|nr:ABC transporter permease subunit [Anaerolineales bacterium]